MTAIRNESSNCSLSPETCRPGRDPETTQTSVIAGQLLTFADQHKIAVHSRAGELLVAEFHGDHAELLPATAWFRLNHGICHTSFSLRRALRLAVPLSEDMVVAIEKLHHRRLVRAPVSNPLRLIPAVRIAGHQASIILTNLVRRCGFIGDRLAASKKPVRRVA